MQKKRKKWVIILCVVLGIILSLLIAGYVAVNVIFSMVSNSFYQSLVTVEQSATQTALPPLNGDQGGEVLAPNGGSDLDITEILPGVNPAKLNMTAAEFKEIEKKVSFNDKLAVLNVLSLGLSKEDYQEVVGIVNDGITVDEVKKAYKIVSENLTKKEKDKIWSYYYKYLHLVQ